MTSIWIYTVFIIGLNGVCEASLCSARGRFPDENVANCQGFTVCLQSAPGNYTQLNLTCPEEFVYSHIDSQCTNVTSYQCYPDYKCVDVGNFEASKDKNCTMYVACVNGLSQIATARLVQCPENTLYSPVEGSCVNSSIFTCITDNTPNVVDTVPPMQESSNTSTNSTNNAVSLCMSYGIIVYLLFILAV